MEKTESPRTETERPLTTETRYTRVESVGERVDDIVFDLPGIVGRTALAAADIFRPKELYELGGYGPMH